MMILRVGFHPTANVGERWIFLVLGCLLSLLCVSGTYFCVLRPWVGCVRYFHFDGRVLRYRTVFSSTLVPRFIDELDLIVTRRPNLQQADAGSWQLLQFRDGEQIKLHLGMLQNVSQLRERLKLQKIQRRTSHRRLPAVILGSESPEWQAIGPHLEVGEQVWWIGRPVYRRLWSEMAAEFIFGMIPATFGLIAFLLGFTVVAKGESSALMLVAVGAMFSSIGFWCMAAPWRYRRMIRDTIYAVTARRALILNGFTWGRQIAVSKVADRVQSFAPEKVIEYEVIGFGRDIVFGGEWRTGRRGRRYWGHHGFLAANDRHGAEAALESLLSEDDRDRSQDEDGNLSVHGNG